MAALEQEIIQKFRLLNKDAQLRVLAQLREQQPAESAASWLEETRALRAEMRAKYGKLAFSAADLINEMREERLNDLMDRY